MKLEAELRRLVDLEAIRDLARRYAHCVWQRDADGAAALFTEDGVMDTGDRTPLRGREAMLATYAEIFARDEFRPMIHNHIIEFEAGDTRSAGGICYLDVEAVVDGVAMAGKGYYEDRYTRAPDGWKFRVRKLTMCYFVEADRTPPAP